MIIYHGSDKIIKTPLYGYGRTDNDYGPGFYCTEDMELAREWACRDERGGFVNAYQFPVEGLKVLDLDQNDVIPWLALLVHNRKIRYDTPIERQTSEYIISHFLPDTSEYDVIRGYRADDSYFSYARAFLSNGITLQQLADAMKYGDLGIQIFLKSRLAFEQIRYIEDLPVDGKLYYPRRLERDSTARSRYHKLLEDSVMEGIYARDIIRGGMDIDELRI